MALVSVDTDRSPILAFTRMVATFNHIKKISSQNDDIVKWIYVTGVGWPSAGRGYLPKFEREPVGSRKVSNASEMIIGNATEQADFVARLICASHRKGGLRYFYHYAFDPLWLYPNGSDQKANWGLIDADRLQVKKEVALALNPQCGPGEGDSSEEDEAARQQRKESRIRAIGFGVGGVALIFILMLALILVFWRRKREADQLRVQLATRHLSSVSSNDTSSKLEAFLTSTCETIL